MVAHDCGSSKKADHELIIEEPVNKDHETENGTNQNESLKEGLCNDNVVKEGLEQVSITAPEETNQEIRKEAEHAEMVEEAEIIEANVQWQEVSPTKVGRHVEPSGVKTTLESCNSPSRFSVLEEAQEEYEGIEQGECEEGEVTEV